MPSAVARLEAAVALVATGTMLGVSVLRDPLLVLDALKLFPSWTSLKKNTPFRSGNDLILITLAFFFFLGDVQLPETSGS